MNKESSSPDCSLEFLSVNSQSPSPLIPSDTSLLLPEVVLASKGSIPGVVRKHLQPNFRCNAKRFFLTYPTCGFLLTLFPSPEDFSKLEIFKDFKYVMVAYEKHKDGSDHIHVILEFSRKMNVKNPRKWDLTTKLASHHCNIGAVRNLRLAIKYLKKGNNFYSTFPESFMLSTTSKHAQLVDDLFEGATPLALLKEYPSLGLQYWRNLFAIQAAIAAVKPPPKLPDQLPKLEWEGVAYHTLSDTERVIYNWLRVNLPVSWSIDGGYLPVKPFKSSQLALISPTNYGKSSLINLLDRFYPGYEVPKGGYYSGWTDSRYAFAWLDEYHGNYMTLSDLNVWLQGSPAGNVINQKNKPHYRKRQNVPTIILSNYPVRQWYTNLFERFSFLLPTLEARLKIVDLVIPIFTLIDHLEKLWSTSISAVKNQ